MYDKSKPQLDGEGNTRYEGYCSELTQKLAEEMNFEFEFVFPEDGKYGAKEKNGSWNGMVGDLTRGVSKILIICRKLHLLVYCSL